jgi:adenylate cyclase
MTAGVQRKLTTILEADAEGYSREMAVDEVRALEGLRAARGVFTRRNEQHGKRSPISNSPVMAK